LRSIIAETLKQSIRMKQTVSIPATDINVVSKSSVLTMWLNRENQLFSSVLEDSVSNRQVCLMTHASLAFMALAGSAFKKLFQKVCGLKNNPHICSAQHLIQARRLAKIFAAGIFYVHGYTYSSVPCGALMRPQPVSGVEQRGAELFLFPSVLNQHNVSF
jgi:hypothetical protein